jgi:uncharacterized protein YdeI (YjbR/CyaY-like superfamily)
MKQLYCSTLQEWRDWLSKNHDKENEIWFVYYKKGSSIPTVGYEESVEEALCFAWIDSLIHKIDEACYARKFTPRKDSSKWSPSNKKRVEKLILERRMTAVGLAKVETAKKNGMWDKPDRPDIDFRIPEEFRVELDKNKNALLFFEQLSSSDKKQFIGWISVAKRPETKEKRIKESIRLLEKKRKLGLV